MYIETLSYTNTCIIVHYIADFTSTLEVMVDDIDNGTNITCQTLRDKKHRLIINTSKCKKTCRFFMRK